MLHAMELTLPAPMDTRVMALPVYVMQTSILPIINAWIVQKMPHAMAQHSHALMVIPKLIILASNKDVEQEQFPLDQAVYVTQAIIGLTMDKAAVFVMLLAIGRIMEKAFVFVTQPSIGHSAKEVVCV